MTRQKAQSHHYVPNGYLPSNYSFKFKNVHGDKKFFYTGISSDVNTRYQNHFHEKSGLLEEWQRQIDPFPQSKEALLQRYLVDYRPAIAENSRGFTDAYIDSPDIPKIVEFVDRHQRQLDIDWVREFPHLHKPNLIPESGDSV
jgi:oligoribonuclease (3'-5' exoribonuclease)